MPAPEDGAPVTSTASLSGRGGAVAALVVTPRGNGPFPAVVLGAEAFGINTFSRLVAKRLASECGVVVVVPDYYRGEGPTRPDDYLHLDEVREFIAQLDFARATTDLLVAIDHARAMPSVDSDRVVVWGYCTGGTLALLAACLDRRLAGAVLFFPSQPVFSELTAAHPVQPMDLVWAIGCPVLLIYGDRDATVPDHGAALAGRMAHWGIEHTWRVYPGAGHAFSAPGPPFRHDQADRDSWRDATAFFRQVAARPTG